jgi:hypothetical protein
MPVGPLHDEYSFTAAEGAERRGAGVTARADARSSDDAILEAVLRDAPIGVVVLDRDLRVVRVSLVAGSDGALTAADTGRRLFDAWPAVPEDVVAALHRVACGRASRVDMRSDSPDWRADRITIAAVTDPDGTVDHVVWMWTDAGHARRLNGVASMH